ncbi:NACHT domain-containing protein [Rhizobium sp. 768_B6_N1_8]|uniref:NACHT domain-containing protein n=1 Tax=unclassified Rhizobium TaxID=2613769 RepID=UPI003F280D57
MYIPRTLIVAKGTKEERIVEEGDIGSMGRVVVLLGEPGIGKTELTKQLETTLGAKRVAAGTFYRSADPSVYHVMTGAPLIIDGLDEVPTSNAEPSLDRILTSLSKLKNPNVIISCRAADWTGASNRQKFRQDYGVTPVSVHIQPFSHEQATAFLIGFDAKIAADQLLNAIRSQSLDDLVGNPLTLRLIAEVWLKDDGLPTTKTELLRRATELLTDEENPAHDLSRQAQLSTEKILEIAGGIFSHLLLAGAVGVATGSRRRTPEGFVPTAELNHLNSGNDVETAIKTRLFRSETEDQLVPVHRVIAEYLAAQWLSQKLDSKLSERRLFRLIEVNGGIPSALRGLHAWLGYFSPKVRERCIDTDPYGFLRYGDTASLGAQSARHLLKALTKLAEDDPYFRSEDWGVRSIAGLARTELKPEIVGLISSPQRHVQLSALILTSLSGSSLTNDIVPELLGSIQDSKAPFVERSAAAEALAKSDVNIDWQGLIKILLAQGKSDSSRLAAEAVSSIGPTAFSADIIASTVVNLNGMNESERREARVAGVDCILIKRTPSDLSQEVLDIIAVKIASKRTGQHWHPGRSLTSAVLRLLASALDGPSIAAERFWSWISHIESQRSIPEDALDRIKAYLQENNDLRREVQRVALYDTSIDGGPWMAIVHELPRALPGLNITHEDAIFFLSEIMQSAVLDDHQITLWGDLVRATGRAHRHDEALGHIVAAGTEKHPELAALYEEITRPPPRDYEAEENKRREEHETERQADFRRHRAEFAKDLEKISSGQHIGALVSLANAYLNRYSDLDNNADPITRLKEWVGEEIARSAAQGFDAALHREDLPDLGSIWSIRHENKHWTIEPVMLAGVTERIRTAQPLDGIPDSVVDAVLGIWWDMPEFHASKLGEEIEKALENVVFEDAQRAENFVTTVIETQFENGKPNISGLYRFLRDQRFLTFSPRLAIKWLKDFPQASHSDQLELLQFLLHRNDKTELVALARERTERLDLLDKDCQQLWMATEFCISPFITPARLESGALSKDMIWPIKHIVLPDRTEGVPLVLPIDRYEVIIECFAPLWPSVGYPASGWGGAQNPWDASDFILYCINALGSDRTAAGTEALERLSLSIGHTNYAHQVKHVISNQRRNRRDQEYIPPTIQAIAKILSNAEPSSVSDLQAVILDHLADLQQYVVNADTRGWEIFWEINRPKVENTCRDRLLDLLRPRLSGAVELFPELPMPDQNRVDIYATILGQGLPIEIKGQWHPELWNASKTQLDEKYARDWRTSGRGVYLVFWFGNVKDKNLTRRPDGKPLPTSPSELQTILFEGLGEGEQSRIDVIVFDVSKRAPVAPRQGDVSH